MIVRIDKNLIPNTLKELKTNRLILRWFTPNDLYDVFEYASDEIVVKYLTWPKHDTVEVTKTVLEKYFYNQPGKYAIELDDRKKCIGCIELRFDFGNDKCSFGYVLNRKYWNQGIMTEALEEIIRVVFNELQLNRIESTHYVGNEASGKVMSKCGMKYEGMCKKELVVKGKYYDVVHYGLIKEEWKRN